MAAVEKIGWGKYRTYSGPFYRGKHSFKLPTAATESEKVLAVITATEGGKYDAINMYDRGIISSGLIQWIEAGQYSVSDMLGTVLEESPEAVEPLLEHAQRCGLVFKKNARNRWRLFFNDQRGEVDLLSEQQQAFLLNSDGQTGWNEASKIYAKSWAAAVASVWENDAAQKVQVKYTVTRLRGFALPFARRVLDSAPGTDVAKAFTAAYLSFAVNNPSWAEQALKYSSKQGANPFELNGLIEVLKQLTFYKGITIYPHRYNAIRPVLEQLYNLNLPDFADELKAWRIQNGFSRLWTTKEVQTALLRLGYDLGPWGVDGRWGSKTTEALLAFERASYPGVKCIPTEFVDGKMDAFTAHKLEEVSGLTGHTP
jgi:hypothetical protein